MQSLQAVLSTCLVGKRSFFSNILDVWTLSVQCSIALSLSPGMSWYIITALRVSAEEMGDLSVFHRLHFLHLGHKRRKEYLLPDVEQQLQSTCGVARSGMLIKEQSLGATSTSSLEN